MEVKKNKTIDVVLNEYEWITSEEDDDLTDEEWLQLGIAGGHL